ncbi:1-acyl-sn-glycerol-3-phosphate acyltransferase [bacterium]|nr:1-acyl-sn-glycerol-3-phosphate acyltransferase [bacterium]
MTLTSHAIVLLAKLFSGSTVRWVDCQPDTSQRIYFANHTSHLDAVLLWSALPRDLIKLTRPVAAKDYWAKGWVKPHMAKSFNALLVDRKEIKVHKSPIDIMLQQMGDIYSLIIFPEGGRSSSDDEMGNFKSGLFYMAKKRPDLELVPVNIDNVNRILPRGEVLPVPLLSCISIGAPIFLEAGEPKAEFLNRARQSVLNLKEH